jgi:hypothetical protein
VKAEFQVLNSKNGKKYIYLKLCPKSMDFNNSYNMVKTEIKGDKSPNRKTNIYPKLHPKIYEFHKNVTG